MPELVLDCDQGNYPDFVFVVTRFFKPFWACSTPASNPRDLLISIHRSYHRRASSLLPSSAEMSPRLQRETAHASSHSGVRCSPWGCVAWTLAFLAQRCAVSRYALRASAAERDVPSGSPSSIAAVATVWNGAWVGCCAKDVARLFTVLWLVQRQCVGSREVLTDNSAVAWILAKTESLQEERNSKMELRPRLIALRQSYHRMLAKLRQT
jgi:hypothetical protein